MPSGTGLSVHLQRNTAIIYAMNNQAQTDTSPELWKFSSLGWVVLLAASLLLIATYQSGLSYMVHLWTTTDEYSYGPLIPLIALFFVWQKKDELERVPFRASWQGPVIVAIAALLYILGELSTLYVVIQYAFLIALLGTIVAIGGWQTARIIWAALFLLIFMIPLPNFLYQSLSAQLQLISSQIGVAVIRLFDISVYLEGNVIDLGTMKLQVIEACSGLRYLFPLMTLGFVAAYLFKTSLWKRVVVLLSTIPITVLMNSFRIGVIGVMVEYWGQGMAEGFLHDFEGWFIFMACTGLLILEMWLLTKVGRDRRSLSSIFTVDFPNRAAPSATVHHQTLHSPFYIAFTILVVTSTVSLLLPSRADSIPDRKDFAEFPYSVSTWRGEKDRIDQIYIDILKLDDYLMANFSDQSGSKVNFYVAYYATQRAGESAHSPRSCLPGGGWEIADLRSHTVSGLDNANAGLTVNRALIKQGDMRQLVYYWFQQRGRVITNEYAVKWYLFWDALTKNRTDGALVRVMTIIPPGQNLEDGERNLESFVRAISPVLPDFVPGP